MSRPGSCVTSSVGGFANSSAWRSNQSAVAGALNDQSESARGNQPDNRELEDAGDPGAAGLRERPRRFESRRSVAGGEGSCECETKRERQRLAVRGAGRELLAVVDEPGAVEREHQDAGRERRRDEQSRDALDPAAVEREPDEHGRDRSQDSPSRVRQH